MISLPFDRTLKQAVVAGALMGLAMPMPTWAHGDEDHSHDEQTAAAPAAIVPDAGGARAAAQTELFELVAVMAPPASDKPASKPQLVIYLDRFDANTPVADASVEIESGAFKGTAVQQSPGVYTLEAGPLARPGRHLINVTVDAAEASDLLSLTLQTDAHLDAHAVSDSQPHGPEATWWSRHIWLTGAGALAAVAAAAVALARLRKGRT